MDLSRVAIGVGAAATLGVGAVALWAVWPTRKRKVERELSPASAARPGKAFDDAFKGCTSQETLEDVQRCMAAKLYPGAPWPPPPNADAWQKEAWKLIEERVRGDLDIPPRGSTVKKVVVVVSGVDARADRPAMPVGIDAPRESISRGTPLPLPTRILFGASIAGAAAAGGVLLYSRMKR